MTTLVLVGLQWGDEGKATIVDVFAAQADVVVRYSGGANAGHTVVIGTEKFVFHLLPVGVLHPGKICVIANGVVIDLEQLFKEIDEMGSRGLKIGDNLLVSSRCHVTMPYHKSIEKLAESLRGKQALETTLRGVGPTIVDKFARSGVMVADLFHERILLDKLRRNTSEKNLILERAGLSERFDADVIVQQLRPLTERIRPFVANTSMALADYIDRGKKVLFEGAQGTLLDIEHGTYPFVTSSHPVSGGACTGSGVPPTKIDRVVGVLKAYCTRVGAGPFPTEDLGDAGKLLRERGKEFGATTGRPRRCGWLDLVALRYAARINGITSIVVTKMDVLDVLEEIPVCIAYDYRGERLMEFPPEVDVLADCRPVYERLAGWRQSTRGVTDREQLPPNAMSYLGRIEKETGVAVALVSTGPRRDETVVLQRDLISL
nr:adenylosuccinate synthase [Bacillota bacterium]